MKNRMFGLRDVALRCLATWRYIGSGVGIALLFGGATGVLSRIGHMHPLWIEQWYSRGFFQILRIAWDNSIGRLPFPAFYLFWGVVLAYWVWRVWRSPAQRGWLHRVRYWILQLLAFSAVIFGLFYWMWGFNYSRLPIARQLGLQPVPLDTAALWDELRLETKVLDSLRVQLTGSDTTALTASAYRPAHMEDTVRVAVTRWLLRHHFPANGRVRARLLTPQGVLLAFGASGLYWPFGAEGNVDAGLHPLQYAPVMAHEMAHGYGFGDEGICNFIAYASGYQHPNPYIAYATRLTYWRTVAANCRKADRNRYNTTFRPFIPAGIRQDVRAIETQMDQFPELLPSVRYQVYDTYLKSQGINAGMLNYSEVIMLVRAMRQQ
jgi:Protein of unknown function (DUF3810)